MKRFIYILSIIAMLSSCTEFLTEENTTKYSVEYVYGTPEGLELAVDALYARYREYWAEGECVTPCALIRATDIVTSNGGTGNYFGIYDPNNLRASAGPVLNMWRTMYSIIGNANAIIAAAEEMEDGDFLETVAQARCFRAQSYLTLIRTFDRIWLNTEPTVPDNINDKRRYFAADQKDVFDLIYSDLEYAIANLDWTSSQPGRFNQATARHILAKSALWIKDYQTALAQVDTIDRSGHYSLQPLDKVFFDADLNHSESLMTMQWSSNVGGNLSTTTPKGHGLAALFVGLYRQEIGGTAEEACTYDNWGYTYGRCLANPYLLSLYDQNKDGRYSTWYVHKYLNTSSRTINGAKPGEYLPSYKGGELVRNLMPGCLKYADIWTREPFEAKSFKDVILYRLGETYVMGAEAALMLGDQTKAKYYFNKTWERAGNDKFTGALTIKDIIDEQARECSFEGERWYFLKRMGILIDQVKNFAGNPEYAPSILGRTNLPANPHMVRWPIPETEIINMGAENFPQNPGY